MEDQPKREDESDRHSVLKLKLAKPVGLLVRSRSNAEKAIALLLFILAFLWLVPELQVRYFTQDVPPENVSTLINEYRRTWAQIIGGFGLFVGLYFTWRRVEISQRTLEAQQDQQVTERFTRAIDQLGEVDDKGEPKLEIRLGGIYALERIARDSPERDYSTVMEVLTAYVRQNAPWLPNTRQQKGYGQYSKDNKQDESASTPGPRADIKAILDVLGRREEDRVPEERRVPLDLRRANLSGARALRANLAGVNLAGANLQEAFLHKANLQEVNLFEANLQEADLYRANLQGAYFQGAKLQGAILKGAILDEAIGLTQHQIESATGDKETQLPSTLHHPSAWSRSTSTLMDIYKREEEEEE